MNRTFSVGLGFFLIFFTYFSFTSYHLPNSAGPDFSFSRAAADFYYAENRMAVLPEDEDKMVFSRYGNSRLLRPPLGFYLPAVMAKIPILKDLNRAYSYRVTIAMLAGLTVMFIFLALKTYFSSLSYAVFGTLSIALLPQFSFYASYFSDDMIAFLASSILAYAIVVIFKHGISLWKQLLFAFAAGLCVISKQTAWIFLAPAIAFYLIFMLDYSTDYFKSRNFYLPLGLMAFAFIIGGGWWLIFNMYHYGVSEFMLSKTVEEITNRNKTIDFAQLGYAAKDIGIKHLLIVNFDNFLGATYIAFVGNLDWLRIRVGSLQYGFYLWIIAGILLNGLVLIYQSVDYAWKRWTGVTFENYPRTFILEILFFFAILLQIYMYTDHNVNADIQIQGKYLMTIFIPMLVLALSFYQKMFVYLSERFDYFEAPNALKITILVVLFSLPVLVHLDALVDYVIPFYWPELEISVILNWL